MQRYRFNLFVVIAAFLFSTSAPAAEPATINTAATTAPKADDRLECLLQPYEEVAVSSEVPGVIDRIYVERGDRVKRGQLLIALKAGVEKAAVALAKAKVDFGQRKEVRNKELFQKEMISEHEKDEMETENQMAALELEEAEQRLKMRTIRSPIKGVVVDRHNAPGEYVGADPILILARIDLLNVEVIVPVEQFGTIRKGMQAEVYPEIPPDTKVKGKVVIVDQVIDAASGTFGVRVEVANPKHQLAAGVKCRVRFLGK